MAHMSTLHILTAFLVQHFFALTPFYHITALFFDLSCYFSGMFQTCLKFPFSWTCLHLLSLILPFISFLKLVFWEFSPQPLLHFLLFFPDFSSLLFVQHRASQSLWWHVSCILPPRTALPPSYDNMLVIWAAPPCAESRAGGSKETEPTWVCTELDLWVQIHSHFCNNFLHIWLSEACVINLQWNISTFVTK